MDHFGPRIKARHQSSRCTISFFKILHIESGQEAHENHILIQHNKRSQKAHET